MDAALRRDDDAITKRAVSRDAYLARKDHVFTQVCSIRPCLPARRAASCHPRLSPWPTWTRLSIFTPLPITVWPTLARSIA